MTEKTSKTAKTRKHGDEKFVEKYDCKTFQAYEIDPESLIVPGKDHPLYDADGNTTFDPLRVAEIDRAGSFIGAVIIWSDPDRRALYVIEGRGLVFDVREVNRRRRERGDAEMKIKFMRWNGDLESAIEHVRIRNFHRKRPSLSHIGREVVSLFRLGKSWSRIAEILHLEGEDATEKHLRKVAALAYCTKEVAALFDAGKLSLAKAKKFGGKEIDGQDRLGDDEQAELLTELLEGKERAPRTKRASAPAVTVNLDWGPLHERLTEHLAFGMTQKRLHDPEDRKAGRLLLAFLARLDGNANALDVWPSIAAVVNDAFENKKLEAPAPLSMALLAREPSNGTQAKTRG